MFSHFLYYIFIIPFSFTSGPSLHFFLFIFFVGYFCYVLPLVIDCLFNHLFIWPFLGRATFIHFTTYNT
jgi:hypothetical protein